jgi:hypothetical protein
LPPFGLSFSQQKPRQFEFDASKLKAGENLLTLTVPAGPINCALN